MAVLVLLRHGESAWNAQDVFTGWIDVGLSELGRRQAERAGLVLADRGFFPDVVHTSVQRRAIVSADLALAACGRSWVPVRRSWRLNSNHYGALQGRGKAEVRAEAGPAQFMAWRRGFRVRPPLGEPLADVTLRLLPYWCDAIVPDLCAHGCVLVVSHGNTLRALVKHLEAVSDEAVSRLQVPNASPLCYEFQAGRTTRVMRSGLRQGRVPGGSGRGAI
jgi:2,3-bisphosphoglycerate-dependent phosphoglycerate mutase